MLEWNVLNFRLQAVPGWWLHVLKTVKLDSRLYRILDVEDILAIEPNALILQRRKLWPSDSM